MYFSKLFIIFAPRFEKHLKTFTMNSQNFSNIDEAIIVTVDIDAGRILKVEPLSARCGAQTLKKKKQDKTSLPAQTATQTPDQNKTVGWYLCPNVMFNIIKDTLPPDGHIRCNRNDGYIIARQPVFIRRRVIGFGVNKMAAQHVKRLSVRRFIPLIFFSPVPPGRSAGFNAARGDPGRNIDIQSCIIGRWISYDLTYNVCNKCCGKTEIGLHRRIKKREPY